MKIAIGLLLLALAAGCGTSDSSDKSAKKVEPFNVYGDVTVSSASGLVKTAELDECTGVDGFSDIVAGAQVVVRDANSKQVGIGTLTPGKIEQQSNFGVTSCRFDFAVKGVPDKGNIFSVEIAHRGQVSFKKADAQNVKVSLG